MRNRPTSIFSVGNRGEERPWRTDGNPTGRLCWLFVAMCLPLAAVAVRVAWLQCVVAERFTAPFEATTGREEPIPSVDGRILATDGRVLAYDLVRFDIRVHYRWLEEPADPTWLRRQALARLSRAERRNRQRVQLEERSVEQRRGEMWRRLSELCHLPLEELADRRTAVQRRVERMHEAVEQRRREAERDRHAAAHIHAEAPWWRLAWWTLAHSLTTPPRRPLPDPLVIEEQESDHVLIANVPHDVAVEIESNPGRFPGVRVEMTTERAYPQGALASHIVGVRTPLDEAEAAGRPPRRGPADPSDYRGGDRIGRTGVERAYEGRLRGLRGLRRIVTNRYGEVVSTEVLREPRLGKDVVLTLHLPLQERAEALLDRALAMPPDAQADAAVPSGGSIVVLDVHDGAILAAVSAPRFDLRALAGPQPQEWQALLDDPRQPLFPRVTHMTLAPGSVFKVVTAVAALQSSAIDPDQPIYCRGYLDTPEQHRCYIFRRFGHSHGEMDLTSALAQSCNVYFFEAARRMGPVALFEWARRFGFGLPTGVDLPGERGGNLPLPPQWADPTGGTASRPAGWYGGETLGLAIGQSRLTATPLQIARMMAALANGGYLVTPHVAASGGASPADVDAPGNLGLQQPRPIPGLSAATLQTVRAGLEQVVAHPRGTGYKHVRLERVAIAGKTGTAEVGSSRPDHAWFAGYVPADQPRVAFCVVLEHGGGGSAAAGPVARQLVEALLETGVLEPPRVTWRN